MPMMSAGPGGAGRPARLQSDFDERRAICSVSGDGRAGRLNIADFAGNVLTAEYRDGIATGCGDDRPGGQDAQTPIAARGPHQWAACVPNCRETVTQDGVLWGLVEQEMGVQVDEAGEEGASKVDKRFWFAKMVEPVSRPRSDRLRR
jgi:hypothetical protein